MGHARHGLPVYPAMLASGWYKLVNLADWYGLRLPCPCRDVVSRIKPVGSSQTCKSSLVSISEHPEDTAFEGKQGIQERSASP